MTPLEVLAGAAMECLPQRDLLACLKAVAQALEEELCPRSRQALARLSIGSVANLEGTPTCGNLVPRVLAVMCANGRTRAIQFVPGGEAASASRFTALGSNPSHFLSLVQRSPWVRCLLGECGFAQAEAAEGGPAKFLPPWRLGGWRRRAAVAAAAGATDSWKSDMLNAMSNGALDNQGERGLCAIRLQLPFSTARTPAGTRFPRHAGISERAEALKQAAEAGRERGLGVRDADDLWDEAPALPLRPGSPVGLFEHRALDGASQLLAPPPFVRGEQGSLGLLRARSWESAQGLAGHLGAWEHKVANELNNPDKEQPPRQLLQLASLVGELVQQQEAKENATDSDAAGAGPTSLSPGVLVGMHTTSARSAAEGAAIAEADGSGEVVLLDDAGSDDAVSDSDAHVAKKSTASASSASVGSSRRAAKRPLDDSAEGPSSVASRQAKRSRRGAQQDAEDTDAPPSATEPAGRARKRSRRCPPQDGPDLAAEDQHQRQRAPSSPIAPPSKRGAIAGGQVVRGTGLAVAMAPPVGIYGFSGRRAGFAAITSSMEATFGKVDPCSEEGHSIAATSARGSAKSRRLKLAATTAARALLEGALLAAAEHMTRRERRAQLLEWGAAVRRRKLALLRPVTPGLRE